MTARHDTPVPHLTAHPHAADRHPGPHIPTAPRTAAEPPERQPTTGPRPTTASQTAAGPSEAPGPHGATAPQAPVRPPEATGPLAGRVALVTGAAGGIGAAVVEALRADGATVVGADLVAGRGVRALDVRDPEAVERLVAEVESAAGPIGVLVNVAGVLRVGAVLDTTEADWAEVFAVNATGVFTVSRAVARRMVGRRSGAIVTVGSNAAGVPRMHMAAYAAAKAAAAHFTRCLGLELAGSGVRCNVVAPGSTDTSMLRALAAAPEDVIAGSPAAFKAGIPLGRVAAPADVADAVAFLVSDRARHVTMHDLYVDGGATLRAG